jgi:hypothetical protein
MVAPMKSPRSPEDVLRRVIRLSRLNGWSVVLFAGPCAVIALAFGDLVSFAVGALVAVGGAIEVRGSRGLRRRDPDGMRLLVRSQLVVLGVIWVYAVSRLMSFDEGIAREMATPDMQTVLAELGLSLNDIMPLVRQVHHLLYASVIVATLFYQGGLALYYRRRTAAVTEALRAPPSVPAGFAAGAQVGATPFSGIDQRFFDLVADELAGKDLKPGLWARALAEAGADDARTQAFYIRLRVAELQREESARQS